MNGQRVQPAALPPGSDAFLFTQIGWRQAELSGVTGFRVYRNGQFALDHLTTELPPGTDVYQTEDYAAELMPGQTTTYAVAAYGNGKESAASGKPFGNSSAGTGQAGTARTCGRHRVQVGHYHRRRPVADIHPLVTPVK
ncbi:MAG: hypothetical protein IMX00_09600 [Limnochordales bacterium]|nr:hypothetical protein [Limnochordales bacterium]